MLFASINASFYEWYINPVTEVEEIYFYFQMFSELFR